MALKYNPFTGSLDQVGSGGGGSSYIDGEVATYADLPVTVGTPAVDSAYLVRTASGSWGGLVNRRPAGIYVRTANAGALSDWTYASAFPDVFNASNFLLYDNADSSKNLQFNVSSITTGTTRTLTVPNASGTIMLGSQNLASLTDLPTARTNLGLGSGDSPTFTNLTLSRGTITTSSPVAITQTWNAGGVTFTALDVNVTNTASAAASMLMNLRVGGTTMLNVRRDGVLFSQGVGLGASDQVANRIGFYVAGTERLRIDGSCNIFGSATMALQWFNGTALPLGSSASVDLIVTRDAAGTIAQRNGANAQTSRLYGTYTDSSNGRWLNLGSTTGGRFTLSATGNGTGASGNELVLASPILTPASSVTLGTNGDLAFEATSNTSLTIRYRGSDGTTRSTSLTLS